MRFAHPSPRPFTTPARKRDTWSRRRITVTLSALRSVRDAIEDVEFTLVLTICLVVMVIFVFLRNVPATLIPGATVPLAIMGTAAVMYLIGYSLDNISLMALTIAVGFVVDDAIVMLENIYRHVENGMSARDAALRGSGEISFTIISISVSLVAVFIPLLLMGGIIGRLFREFAVTVTLTIAISVVVSLTLTPMLCALFLHEALNLFVTNEPLTFFRADRPLVQDAQRMQREMAGMKVFYITLEANADRAFQEPANLQKLADIQAFMAKQAIFDRSTSLADLLSLANRETGGGHPDAYRVPASRKAVAQKDKVAMIAPRTAASPRLRARARPGR